LKKFDAFRRDFEIFLVDDSAELASVYERAFKAAGLKVVEKFRNGTELLQYFALTKNGSNEGIVLLDHKMPEMNGLEIARRIKELYPSQRIILALAEAPVKFKIDPNFFDGMIFKPFTISELLDEIERIVSPIRIKGSRIIEDPVEIENLLRDILSDSTDKVCSIRNPEFIRKRAGAEDQSSTYVSAKSKGLSVFLITQITPENLAYCKLLLLNQGVELRHCEGLLPNFAVWDKKHSLEGIQTPSSSSPYGNVLYSNLESEVNRNLYLFEYFWNKAAPAAEKIRELDESLADSLSVLTNEDEIARITMDFIRHSQSYIKTCLRTDDLGLRFLQNPEILEARKDAALRKIQIRVLTDITKDNVELFKKVKGTEVRHLQDSKSAFAVSEKEVLMSTKNSGTNQPPLTIYSNSKDFVDQHNYIFDTLWCIATPADVRIKELEEKQEREVRNN